MLQLVEDQDRSLLISKDITEDTHYFDYPNEVSMRSYNPNVNVEAEVLDIAVKQILAAEKPVIMLVAVSLIVMHQKS